MAKEDKILSELSQIKKKLDAIESEVLFLTRLMQHPTEVPEYPAERPLPRERGITFPGVQPPYGRQMKTKSKK